MFPEFQVRNYIVSSSYPETAKSINPSVLQERNLFLLHTTVLMPFFLKSAIKDEVRCRVLSGLRSNELNRLVGGVIYSDHKDGNAVDVTAGADMWNFRLFSFLNKHPFIYGQLIAYLRKDSSIRFIHVSLPTNRHYKDTRLKFFNSERSEPFKCMSQIRF